MSHCKLLTAVVVLFLLGACGEDRLGYDEIKQTMTEYPAVSSWETAGLCGGLNELVGCPKSAIGVTPLLLFRKVG
ncbi:protein of unknown function [Pseudodesulfovibrio profundus]|uniref:Lipoprotein n=1 Tax=Pseudodesulfovibrio profundus TaxID=57320 RepID=A0A2C8FDQ0_9BACT|nr:protein of unknown function [Pseudodesulfovibrio profundus]